MFRYICNISKICNASGHFKPKAKECVNSFVRELSNNIMSSLNNNGINIDKKSVAELFDQKRKNEKGDYSIGIDISETKLSAREDSITLNSRETQKSIITEC